MPQLQLKGICRTYAGPSPVHALADVNLTVEQGDYLAIVGPSGSGKSTLLNQIALLDTPTNGEYQIDGKPTTGLNDAQRARLRSQHFAFIFQSFHLLEGRTVLDNVAMGTFYRGLPTRRRQQLAGQALSFVGLKDKEMQRAQVLSGGEQQRVAIARAIASSAPVVVADEPTGNLDRANGQLVMDTLERMHAQGATLIVVTHDPQIAARADRRLSVLDGHVKEEPTHQAPEEKAAPQNVPSPEGRPARARFLDILADIWKGMWSKKSRVLPLVTAVALGVGLALTTAGLATTARYQVSDIFDAVRNRRVAMAFAPAADSSQALETVISSQSLQRIRSLAGLEDAVVLVNHGSVLVSTSSVPHVATVTELNTMVCVDNHLPAGLMTVDTQGPPRTSLAADEVIVGAYAAKQLNLGPLLASPVIWVNGLPHRVVGVLTDSGLQVSALESVILSQDSAARPATVTQVVAELRVQPGAAQQVAGQAPIAWAPNEPEKIKVDAPPDPVGLRDSIESNLATMLLTLTVVAFLGAVLSLTNSMTAAVFQRTGEFGLRRAIGARRSHITVLVMLESLVIGLLGGVVGAYSSMLAILGVTLARQWQPVFNPALLPMGVAGGVLVGVLGGALATWRASKVEPSDALRG
ncbi:ATP-binding cassette domain-containing protein [Actinomyces trachealis]|uniref:ABC transporter ATP-binding protein/permease n=1 Tax=Actinomyces trachealis TaxID=2763540 RepID=UPI001892B96E|nr:ABC transporter ATP-binding protein/permease [Actinomyces trachealis]